jgi:YVTN family beta-propeller protein
MDSHNSDASRAATARAGFMALFAVLAMGLGLLASPAEAAPFAYVVNNGDNSVSVIDTATNTVVGTPIPVGGLPNGVAITPDGTHAYVANAGGNTVSVIATATNTVGATVLVGNTPAGIAITPDGTRAYVVNCNCFSGIGAGTVSVIDTASNTVVGTPIPVGGEPEGVAVTPDGKHAYVTNAAFSIGSVSVIDTAINTVGERSRWGLPPLGSPSPRMGNTPMWRILRTTLSR